MSDSRMGGSVGADIRGPQQAEPCSFELALVNNNHRTCLASRDRQVEVGYQCQFRKSSPVTRRYQLMGIRNLFLYFHATDTSSPIQAAVGTSGSVVSPLSRRCEYLMFKTAKHRLRRKNLPLTNRRTQQEPPSDHSFSVAKTAAGVVAVVKQAGRVEGCGTIVTRKDKHMSPFCRGFQCRCHDYHCIG